MLYEIAYAFGSMERPFSLYTMLPRQRVNEDCLIRDLTPSTVLHIEEDAKGCDPYLFCDDSMVSRYTIMEPEGHYDNTLDIHE